MRFLKAFVIPLVTLFVISDIPIAHASIEDDDDEDWSEFETEAVDEDEQVDKTALARQADANLTSTERKVRMGLCIGLVRQKFAKSRESMEELIAQIAKLQEVTEEQAAESVHVMMITNCYINMDQARDLPELSNNFDAVADRLTAPAVEGEQNTLTDYQWELIKEFIEKEQSSETEKRERKERMEKRKNADPKEQKEEPKRGRPIEVIGSGMGTWTKLMYFIAVFGAIFGGGYVLVKKLAELQTVQKHVRGRDIRAAEKVAKKMETKKTE